jgi:hypothetical protein
MEDVVEDNFQEDAAIDAIELLLKHMSLLGLSLVLENVAEAIATFATVADAGDCVADVERKRIEQIAKKPN